MRIGLVGIGSMGHAHARAWRALGADVAGVLARSELDTSEFADMFGLNTFRTFEELLDDVSNFGYLEVPHKRTSRTPRHTSNIPGGR